MNTLKALWAGKVGIIIRSAGMVAILGAITELIAYFTTLQSEGIWFLVILAGLKAVQKYFVKK